MAGGEDTPLANGWQGLNRAIAPHLLPPSNSPDTTDAAPSLEAQGLLGPRPGNLMVTNKSYDILGVVPMNFPWGRYRTIATADGTWSNAATPWPSLSAVNPNGWDRADAGNTSASQTGAGTTNGTAKTWSTAITLGNYGERVVYNGIPSSLSIQAGQSVTAKFQGNIASSWVDLISFSFDDSVAPATISYTESMASYTTGSFTQVRAVMTVNSGAGLASVTFAPKFFLLYGRVYTTLTAS